MEDIAICICSCDAYSDIWDIFFKFFNKYWRDCPFQIYLNTETKKYHNNEIKIKVINDTRTGDSWSKRLIKVLKRIPEKYVLIILDDFFILSQVDSKNIIECKHIMDEKTKISCFHFCHMSKAEGSYTPVEFGKYKKRDVCKLYWLNFLPALWRKSDLLKLLSPYENAWQAEWFGTQRAKLSGKDFYTLADGEPPVIDYDITLDNGFGLCQGRWTKKTKELFEKEGITINFDKRGFCDPKKISTCVKHPKMLLRHRIDYFLHGGIPEEDICATNGEYRLNFITQFLLIFKHPRTYYRIMKNKIDFLFERNYMKNVDTRYGYIDKK